MSTVLVGIAGATLVDRAVPGGGVVLLVRPAARPMPAQPPTPDSTPTYCLPLCIQVLTLPMIPDGVLKR